MVTANRLPVTPARLTKALAKGPVPIDLSGLTGPDDRVVAAVNSRITVSNALTLLNDITGQTATIVDGESCSIVTRNSISTGYELAIRYLEQFYRGLTLRTQRKNYKVQALTRPNLEAFFPADKPTRRTLIVGSHVDSTAGSPKLPEDAAPGADDDGTGTVAAMLLAATLNDLRKAGLIFNCNVRIAHFGSEELVLIGSTQYVEDIAEEDIEVIGMLQLEMMGYDGSKERRVDLHDDGDKNGSHSLVESLIRSAVRYGADLAIKDLHVFNPYRPSDHRPFLAAGHKAVCISEDSTNHGVNPNMHSTEDTVDKLDMPYFVDVARFVTGGTIDICTA